MLLRMNKNVIEKFTEQKITKFKSNYHKYFLANKKYGNQLTKLDPNPRLILMPNIGIIGIGRYSRSCLRSFCFGIG